MYLSIHQAINLWEELLNAMQGNASHGREAEIYAYTLMPSIPSLKMKSVDHSMCYVKAANSLLDLINLFKEKHNVLAFIDGQDPLLWKHKIGSNFDQQSKS